MKVRYVAAILTPASLLNPPKLLLRFVNGPLTTIALSNPSFVSLILSKKTRLRQNNINNLIITFL